jgi:hypothetical protein
MMNDEPMHEPAINTPAINTPAIVAELTQLYQRYEIALCTNDVATLDALFWAAPEVVRLGATENLYGIEAIRAFRQARSPKNLARTLANLQIVTFGRDTASITLEFCRMVDGIPRQGRQSQTWFRFTDGWKIVSAHVSWLTDP